MVIQSDKTWCWPGSLVWCHHHDMWNAITQVLVAFSATVTVLLCNTNASSIARAPLVIEASWWRKQTVRTAAWLIMGRRWPRLSTAQRHRPSRSAVLQHWYICEPVLEDVWLVRWMSRFAAIAQCACHVQLQSLWEREGPILMCNCIKKLACMLNKLVLKRCLPN